MSQHWFRYGDERIPYKVCFTPSRVGKVTIHVHSNGLVRVDAPEGEAQDNIRSAVLKRARWIASRRSDALRQMERALPRRYVSGESVLYLGRRYKLVVVDDPTAPAARMREGRIEVTAPSGDTAKIRARLLAWYRERARSYFQNRLAVLTEPLAWVGDTPPFELRRLRKQWGNCAPQGRIVLNLALIKAPRECIDYVLLHELCHLREHNHSPAFYALLDRLIPGWKSIKLKLDGMAAEALEDWA